MFCSSLRAGISIEINGFSLSMAFFNRGSNIKFTIVTSNRIKIKPTIKYAARFFKVSEIVIARRALDTGKITRKDFFEFYDEYINREFIKKENQAGGGDFYATTRKRLSMTFAAHVNNAVKSGKLLFRDAYKLTSLKGDTYQTFFNKHF